MQNVSSWGRLIRSPHNVVFLDNAIDICHLLKSDKFGIAYGMGKSYGDVCLNSGGVLWNTSKMDHFVSFDERAGLLRCEAGVLLRDIQRLVIPRGWILPVTPGTQLITVGGAVANDVHGKSHHLRGSFGNHVARIRIVRTNGEEIVCSPSQQVEWFDATVGGLGLTGIIVEVDLQLQRVAGAWLDTETIPFTGLDTFFQLADDSKAWEHTVAWIDCVYKGGVRGIFMRGNHSACIGETPSAAKVKIPFVPPVSLVNKLTLRPFNSMYFNVKKRNAGHAVTHYESFFYPLDGLLEWNRMYGPRGFFQYQCVIPSTSGSGAIQALLTEISQSGMGSFLAVLKTFGDIPSLGLMSFPQQGVTLALDFPNSGQKTLKLFERLDGVVREAGGRLNPSKDARMPKSLFISGYQNLHRFSDFRDPGISSDFSRRLMGW